MEKKNKALQMIQKVVEAKLKNDSRIWPPPCTGILYQPKRPMKSEK